MKAKQQDTTKEGIKSRLDKIATAKKESLWAQSIHKIAIVQFVLDAAGVTDETLREEVFKMADATPANFGCNSAGLNPQLGKPQKATLDEKLENRFKGL